jgi:hypothetical protein
MTDNPKPIRRPGSQVAPGQKPLFRPGQTASTHSRVPLDKATAGKLYRVRDRAEPDGSYNLWGENLTHEAAMKLKDQVVGARRSRTAKIEEMLPDELAEGHAVVLGQNPLNTPPPAPPPIAQRSPSRPPATPRPEMFSGSVGEGQGSVSVTPGSFTGSDPSGPADVTWITALAQQFCTQADERGIRLSRDDEQWIANWFIAATGSVAFVRDHALEEIRRKAVAAAAPVARIAQVRHEIRTAPPVVRRPAVLSAPPTPPPSPLTDEVLEGLGDEPGELPPDETLGNADISDISAEVGGGPSDDDKKRAKAQAESDVAEMTVSAQGAYANAVSSTVGDWPAWQELGEFEHAAWRYYVAQGGAQPELTKTPRKVGHAMGVVP